MKPCFKANRGQSLYEEIYINVQKWTCKFFNVLWHHLYCYSQNKRVSHTVRSGSLLSFWNSSRYQLCSYYLLGSATNSYVTSVKIRKVLTGVSGFNVESMVMAICTCLLVVLVTWGVSHVLMLLTTSMKDGTWPEFQTHYSSDRISLCWFTLTLQLWFTLAVFIKLAFAVTSVCFIGVILQNEILFRMCFTANWTRGRLIQRWTNNC
jgi:hypothetical protein